MPKEEYKVKRLRDGEILTLGASHALNLLRLSAKHSKAEFELAEKNYNFTDNEIHFKSNKGDTKTAKAQGED